MGEAAPLLSSLRLPYSVPVLKPWQLSPCLENLGRFVDRYRPRFYRTEQREHVETVLEGMLGDLPRKTVEPIAVDHEQPRRPLQRFVGGGHWDDADVLDVFHRHVVEEVGDPDGILMIDGSGFPKAGTESVGVTRQWCGRLGKVDNCQVGVFLGYASPRGGTLIDRRLYLPQSWARSLKRREKCHVPPEIRYRSTLRIAYELLLQDLPRFPHRWITGDDEFGRPVWFRRALARRGERYLLEVPGNTSIRDLEAVPPPRQSSQGPSPKVPFQAALDWAKAQRRSRWTRIEVRAGEKGPLKLDAIRCRVRTWRDRIHGPEEILLVTRTPGPNPKIKCWMAPAFADAPLTEMVRVASHHHSIEEFFAWGKGDAGLADYEVRSWVGWHHHMTLSLLALFFLTLERSRLGEKNTGRDGVDDRQGTGTSTPQR